MGNGTVKETNSSTPNAVYVSNNTMNGSKKEKKVAIIAELLQALIEATKNVTALSETRQIFRGGKE